MRLALRFLLPLLLAFSAIAYFSMAAADRLALRWFGDDLEARADLVAGLLSADMEKAMARRHAADRKRELTRAFTRAVSGGRLRGAGYCDTRGGLVAATPRLPALGRCREEGAARLSARGSEGAPAEYLARRPLAAGTLLLALDASYIGGRYAEARRLMLLCFAALAGLISLIAAAVAQLSWRHWLAGVRGLLRRGEAALRRPPRLLDPQVRPIIGELRALVARVRQERGRREQPSAVWTPRALKEVLQRELPGEEVLIVSNREPYMHERKDGRIEARLPASGLVSALEPIMRACSGTWIAHGSGSADRETVDASDCVEVPPGDPCYRLRRVWLTEEEEKGHYQGFSNEGLWPLSHVAHTRPVFRSEDWEMYQRVNRKFALAVGAEARTQHPVVLVQDYHFALLPRLIRERLPGATVVMFWHIPWPNQEAFGICPWREEILHGMLGASILGFHTRVHCNNFLDSVDRFREALVDRESSTVSSGGHVTAVRHYPISIEWPARWLEGQEPVEDARAGLRRELGLPPETKIGVGVDRLDYTKGILERFRAVERLLDQQPERRGSFCFVQVASPSRSAIGQYRDFERSVREEAERINARYERSCPPIVLRAEHHAPFDVFRHYRAADLCLVSSLHDGMNLVAKEFVAARDDEQGVLVLSQFTGAARELPEALIVNPYDVDQCAAALGKALDMSAHEQRERMRSMRAYVREFNVYRWAGRMLTDAARMRQKSRFREKLPFGA